MRLEKVIDEETLYALNSNGRIKDNGRTKMIEEIMTPFNEAREMPSPRRESSMHDFENFQEKGNMNSERRTSGATNVEQQLLLLIFTACRGHSGVNKSPLPGVPGGQRHA